MAPLGGRPDHPAKWVLLKDDEQARRFIIRHGPLFQDNKGTHLSRYPLLCAALQLRRAAWSDRRRLIL